MTQLGYALGVLYLQQMFDLHADGNVCYKPNDGVAAEERDIDPYLKQKRASFGKAIERNCKKMRWVSGIHCEVGVEEVEVGEVRYRCRAA